VDELRLDQKEIINLCLMANTQELIKRTEVRCWLEDAEEIKLEDIEEFYPILFTFSTEQLAQTLLNSITYKKEFLSENNSLGKKIDVF